MKSFFKRKEAPPKEYTVDELIVLERWDEAHDKLQQRLKSRPSDNHARLKFAEVLGSMGRGSDALEQFHEVSQKFAEDGFNDKAMAILNKALRLAPGDPRCMRLLHNLKQEQDMTLTHSLAMDALRKQVQEQEQSGETNLANVTLKVENIWKELSSTKFIRKAPKDQIPSLVEGVTISRFRGGNPIQLKGDKAECLYVVVRGEVEAKDSQGVQLRAFGEGDVFGESTLLEHLPWPAHYFATRITTCLKMERSGLEKAMTGNENPKELLDYLRNQMNDRAVAKFFEDS